MSLYDEVSAATKLTPNDDEGEQEFLVRLTRAANKLPERAFDKLSQEAADWVNDAILAIQNKQPVQSLEGYGDEDEDGPEDPDEDDADADADVDEGDDDENADDGADEDEGAREEAPPAARVKAASKAIAKAASKAPAKAAAKAPAKAAAKAPAKANGKAPAKAAAKPAAKPAAKAPAKAAAPKGDGVLQLLMDEFYSDMTMSASALKKAVESKHRGVEVKGANAIGIRQQVRRVVLFLQRKGALKKDLIAAE